jgi:hypothetical protein
LRNIEDDLAINNKEFTQAVNDTNEAEDDVRDRMSRYLERQKLLVEMQQSLTKTK